MINSEELKVSYHIESQAGQDAAHAPGDGGPPPVTATDLIAFLRARIDEDEQVAQAIGSHDWRLGIAYGTGLLAGIRQHRA